MEQDWQKSLLDFNSKPSRRPPEVEDEDLNVAHDNTFLPETWLCKKKKKQQLFPAPFCHWAVASTIAVATCSAPSYRASFSGRTECEWVCFLWDSDFFFLFFWCSEVTVLSNFTQCCWASEKHLLVAFETQYSWGGWGGLQHTVIKKHRLQQFVQAASSFRGNYDRFPSLGTAIPITVTSDFFQMFQMKHVVMALENSNMLAFIRGL